LLYRLSYALPKWQVLPWKWCALTDLAHKGQLPRLRQIVLAGALSRLCEAGWLVKEILCATLKSETFGSQRPLSVHGGANMRRFITPAFILLSTLAALPVMADGVATTGAQKTIESQINAFRAGKAAEAYSYAAPSIQGYFPTVESFMSMVTGGYSPVVEPKDFQFGKVKEVGAEAVVQEVEIIAKDGTAWVALYSLIKMEDGSWKISGVQLLKSDGGSA
jgi:hypothetical protein